MKTDKDVISKGEKSYEKANRMLWGEMGVENSFRYSGQVGLLSGIISAEI